MSKTEAKRQAHKESHMYRQGRGWIVSTWSLYYRANILTGEKTYENARLYLAGWRSSRTESLLAGGAL